MSQFRSSALSRNPGIDCLRGLSIVLVILNHIGLRMRLSQGVLAQFLPRSFVNSLNFNGSEAVYIFFVISGFLITSNSLARWGSLGAIHLRTFYVRRAARIMPCLLILIAVLSVLHLARVPGYVIDRPDQSLPRAILSAIGLHLNWYEARTWYLPQTGTFSGRSPSKKFSTSASRSSAFSCVKTGSSLPPWRSSRSLSRSRSHPSSTTQSGKRKPTCPAWPPSQWAYSARSSLRYRPQKSSVLLALQCFGVCGIIAVLFFELKLWPFLGNGTLLLLTFSAISLILAFHWHAIDNTHWAIRYTAWLQSFGRLSYEIYLTHMFVVLTVVRIFRSTGASLKWGILWYIPAFGLSWLLGWAVAKYISTPSDRFIRGRFMVPTRQASSTAVINQA